MTVGYECEVTGCENDAGFMLGIDSDEKAVFHICEDCLNLAKQHPDFRHLRDDDTVLQ